jgi:hypothetical protein
MSSSQRVLKILAAMTWYIGGVALTLKSGSLFLEAHALRSESFWLWIAIALGIVAGVLKARTLFSSSCRKNLARIDSLDRPKLWQFFRPRFFLSLALMISLGVTMSKMAHGHYSSLLAVGAFDLSLATALVGSSYHFWKERNAVACNPSI